MRGRFEYRDVESWERAVQASLSPMRVVPREPVRVFYQVSSAATIRVADIDSSPGVVMRATKVAPDPAVVYLGTQRSSEAVMRWEGRAVALEPGWASFYRHGTPIEYEYPAAFRRTVVRIPSGEIGLMPHDLDALEGQPLRLDSAVGRVLDQALRAVTGASDATRLAGPLASLLGAFVDENLSSGEQAAGSVPASHILAMIRDRAREMPLTLQDVADSVHLSPRQVQRVLGAHGTSYQRELLTARLDRAAGLLRREPAASVSEVAARAGFSSLSHFSRTFRSRFGVPPAAWREMQR